jgi:hypothetical protein
MRTRSALVLASIGIVVTSGCVTREEVWIPDDYVGWVTVQYENPECSALPTSKGTRIIGVPSSGTLCTSTSSPLSTRWVRSYYVDNDGSRRELRSTAWGEGGMIWAESGPSKGTSVNGPVYPEIRFFVGTEAQFRATYEDRDDDGT